MKHSSGYINELCYISLAFGLMDASEKVEDGECPDNGAIVRKADYHTNKRLKRSISKYQKGDRIGELQCGSIKN